MINIIASILFTFARWQISLDLHPGEDMCRALKIWEQTWWWWRWRWWWCCYQEAFQEMNILFNTAHLANCNFFLTESLYGKIHFFNAIKVISNLTNILGTIFPGQTYVQKWFLDYGQFCGQIWPFLTLMAIFTHQMAGILAIIWPTVAHGGEQDSCEKFPFALLKWPMPY